MIAETTSGFEKNARGALLMDLDKEVRNLFDSPANWRYNGGWTKRVEGLDKDKTNGYSILGDFAPVGMRWIEPGVYLDCNIGGSRNNQAKEYRLITVERDGSLNAWQHPNGSWDLSETRSRPLRDWAVRLWPLIEQALEDFHSSAPAPVVSMIDEDQDAFRAQVEAAQEMLDANALATFSTEALIAELRSRGAFPA